MTNLLVNIALANAIFEERKNYLDTYYPFVLKAFKDSEICNLQRISSELRQVFNIELPIHSIKDIINRRDKDVFQIIKSSKADWRISLSLKGFAELNTLISRESEIDIMLSEFYYQFLEFAYLNRNKTYEESNVQKLITEFINNNLVQISIQNGTKLEFYPKTEFDKDFILFLAHIRKTSHSLIKTFDHLWKGTIIWNELKKYDQDKQSLEFNKSLSVYVDTNFTLSLLELHNPIINTAARELYDFLVSIPNIDLCILDSTIYEIFQLLEAYPSFKDDFYEIEVDSIFYYLKEKGFTQSKIEKLKDELIKLLREKYKIQFVEGSILTEQKQKWLSIIYDHLFKIRSDINESRSGKQKKSENSIQKNANHDASVITHILGLKDRFATTLENSKAIFLTSSFSLFKNYKNIHKEFEQFSTVILDSTLTNILYLKSPNKNAGLAIDQVIKSHCNYLIINNNIWAVYIDQAKQLLKEEKISIEDYSRLVSKNQFSEEFLIDSDPNEINPSNVLVILDSIKRKENEQGQKIENYENDILVKQNEISDYKRDILEKDREIDQRKNEIKLLNERLDKLEEQRLKDLALARFERDVNQYNLQMNNYIFNAWRTERNSFKKLIFSYLIFVIFSVLVSSSSLIINLKSEEISNEYGIEANLLAIVGLLLGVVLFIIPFIRSFYKHEDIIKAFSIFIKRKRELLFEDCKERHTKKFKEAVQEPVLQ